MVSMYQRKCVKWWDGSELEVWLAWTWWWNSWLGSVSWIIGKIALISIPTGSRNFQVDLHWKAAWMPHSFWLQHSEGVHNLQHFLGRTTQLTTHMNTVLTSVQLIMCQTPNLWVIPKSDSRLDRWCSLSPRKYPNNMKAFFCQEASFRALQGGLEIFKGCYWYVHFWCLMIDTDVDCDGYVGVFIPHFNPS